MVSIIILAYLSFILGILTGSQATQATLLDSLQAALSPKNITNLFFNGKLEESSPNISWTLQNRDTPRDPFLNDPVSDNREDLASANGPMLRSNWVDHCDAKLRTKRAVAEALELARGALDALRFKGGNGRNYARYFSKIPFRTVDDDGDPPNGYGPYNAMRLKQKPGHEPEFNADSYVWFAL
jgi:hypothetical protein